MDLCLLEMALEEVKRRAADRVIEVVEDVVKASSPTPVLVKVGNFSPLPLSGEELMEGPLLVMSTIRREVLCLLNGVKLDNLLVSPFRVRPVRLPLLSLLTEPLGLYLPEGQYNPATTPFPPVVLPFPRTMIRSVLW